MELSALDKVEVLLLKEMHNKSLKEFYIIESLVCNNEIKEKDSESKEAYLNRKNGSKKKDDLN